MDASHAGSTVSSHERDTLAHHASAGNTGIRHRLEHLDGEWTVERVVQAKAAGLAIAGAALAATVDRRFAALPALGGALLLAQAVVGGELFAPMLRPLGFRTRRQVEQERAALKALRGDYRELATGNLAGTRRYDFALAAAGR